MALRDDASKAGPRANVSVSLSYEELSRIEARARALNMSRASYIRHSALRDTEVLADDAAPAIAAG